MTSLLRKTKNHSFTVLAAAACLLVLIPLVNITWFVIKMGWEGLSWEFLTSLPGERPPGIGHAIQGTLYLLAMAVAMGVPVGVLGGSWLAIHGRNQVGGWFRLALDAMAATPSIVVGLFVFAIIVVPQAHYSAFAGSVALAFMIVPVVARTTEVALRAVPDAIAEASVALGATHTRTLFQVTLPAARAGILTGSILAAARVAGETAPLLFTAFIYNFWARGIDDPIAAIPTVIFNYIQQPYESLQQQAWSAALLLFIIVFGSNVIVRLIAHYGGRRT